MDISSILPLLLKNKQMGQKEKLLLSAVTGADVKQELMKQVIGEDNPVGEMLEKMTTEKKENPLTLLKKIAPAEILGKLYKYLN